MDASDLHEVLLGNGVELLLVLHQLRELDVDGGAEGGAEVRRAAGDEAKVGIVRKLADGLDVSGSAAKAVKDLLDTGARLHRDDAKLVLLIDPDKEGLGVIVEDASARRPVAVEVACLEEAVTLLEEEVIVDQLLLSGRSMPSSG